METSDLEPFVEELLGTLPKGKFPRDSAAEQWKTEIEAGARTDDNGDLYAPDQYTLSMHPKDYDALTKSEELSQDALSEALQASLEGSGHKVVRVPHITLATDPTLPRGEMRVIAWHSGTPGQEQVTEDETETAPTSAFFVIDGRKNYALDRLVVNIGRHLDNQLVLEDPHISRRHAQLRVRGNRYFISDLNSTAGTRVNGKEVREATLTPGDVVTLGPVQLIYNEDEGGPPEVTPPYEPPAMPGADPNQVTPMDLSTMELEKPKSDEHQEADD